MEMLQRRNTNQSKHGRSTPSHWWISGGLKNMVASPPLPSPPLSSPPLFFAAIFSLLTFLISSSHFPPLLSFPLLSSPLEQKLYR